MLANVERKRKMGDNLNFIIQMRGSCVDSMYVHTTFNVTIECENNLYSRDHFTFRF